MTRASSFACQESGDAKNLAPTWIFAQGPCVWRRCNQACTPRSQTAPVYAEGMRIAFGKRGAFDPKRILEGNVRIQDVMTKAVETVMPAMEAEEAWSLMRAKRIHHLVVTEGRRIVGVVSDRDMGGRRGASLRAHHTVKDLMTDRVVTVPPPTPVRKAANLMRGRSIGCLVVAETGRVVGIITVADLLELIGRGAERPVAATTRWTLKHRAPHRPRVKATGVW